MSQSQGTDPDESILPISIPRKASIPKPGKRFLQKTSRRRYPLSKPYFKVSDLVIRTPNSAQNGTNSPGAAVEIDLANNEPITKVAFSPYDSPNQLLVASFDKFVYHYMTHILNDNETPPEVVARFEHRAPVLNIIWGPNEATAYSGGADWDVRLLDFHTREQTVLSSHTTGVAYLAISVSQGILVSAAWDKTLHIHPIDTTTGKLRGAVTVVNLPAKPTALAASSTHLLVGMAGRLHHIYSLSALSMLADQNNQGGERNIEPEQRRESSLKFATRSLACRPDDSGFVAGSIEGRVAVEWFDGSEEAQARRYAFKCHRQPLDHEDGDLVYPVHSLAWHPVYDTFATGGGDGVVALWDASAKRRIRQYQKLANAVSSVSFNNDGSRIAIASCVQVEDGKDVNGDGQTQGSKVVIRTLGEDEARGKGKSKS